MRIPESLASLADLGIIEEVVRPLMSGKEAQVYLVIAGGEQRVAKIYKEAQDRTFKHRAEYTEGRKTRNTRDQRAIGKRSAHGRAQDEAAWRSTEVDTIYRLQRAGVRVPVPYNFIDGVLVMELITDGDGNPAPRLGDIALTAEAATSIYERLLREVVRMLCAGVVHGDLSDFNVLLAADGPVLIDFPQSVDPAQNSNARRLLLRDVNNLHDFVGRFVRQAPRPPYAEEMWDLYEANGLTPETPLSGRYRASTKSADTTSVLALIEDAKRDERRRREFLGLKGGPSASEAPPARPAAAHGDPQPRRNFDDRPRGRGNAPPARPVAAPPGASHRQHGNDRRNASPPGRPRGADAPRPASPVAAPPNRPPQNRPPQNRPPQNRPPQRGGANFRGGPRHDATPRHDARPGDRPHPQSAPRGPQPQPQRSGRPDERPRGHRGQPGARSFAAPPANPQARRGKRRHRKGPPPSGSPPPRDR
ncbi:MAG: hypothetical protein JWN44_832 [Myxococcales bacterium]|nr:hypothetical protein [Myxococcales bacterium]